ncbi:hypothetical protein D6C76_05358 [Aureobasidium pullulans]|nr:hypothetical protein D6C76_05358 [Aureobasidium pullulans]
MAEDKARDKTSEAGAHENLRAYQRDYQKEYRDRNREKIRAAQRLYGEQNKDKLKAYREQNKDKMKAYTARYHQQHKQRVAELMRQWSKNNPSRRYEYGRQCAAKREKYNSDKQYRMASRLHTWLTQSEEARQLSWPTHQPILYDTRQSHHCSGCGHGRYIKLWWRMLDENRNPTGEFKCHACFTSDWSRALPIGHENMFVNKRPRPRSPKKASDDNVEDRTETGPSEKPDPPT